MSTPVSERSGGRSPSSSQVPPPPPRLTDAELQLQMQRLIDMQYDVQRRWQAPPLATAPPSSTTANSTGEHQNAPPGMPQDTTTSSSSSRMNDGSSSNVNSVTATTNTTRITHPKEGESMGQEQQQASAASTSSTSSMEQIQQQQPTLHQHQDSFVGVGTVVYNEDKLRLSSQQRYPSVDSTSEDASSAPTNRMNVMMMMHGGSVMGGYSRTTTTTSPNTSQKMAVRPASDGITEPSSFLSEDAALLLPPSGRQQPGALTKSATNQSLLLSSTNQEQQQQQSYPMYGATETTTNNVDGPPPNHYGSYPYHNSSPPNIILPPPLPFTTAQQQQQQQPRQPSAAVSNTTTDTSTSSGEERAPTHRRRGNRSRPRHHPRDCCCCCCCLWRPLVHCISTIWYSESVHRSFCYGAIDGMLTGAGIVSTFCGMQLLSVQTNNRPEIRALVVAFTAATCCADAVCMALGHVWTTMRQQQQHAHERSEARQQLQYQKAESKGRLVDLLLAKGMLKIDAMSLADTLEGYPDLFVSAVTGDSLAAHYPPPQQQQQQHHHYRSRMDDHPEDLHHEEEEEEEGLLYGARRAGPPTLPSATASPVHSTWFRRYASYSRLTELDMDPDLYAVQIATAEARKESVAMMLGFSLFAVVPSLIYTLVPAIWLGKSHDHGGYDSSNSSQPPNTSSVVINPNTLVVSLTSAVMACLGVWKSRFLGDDRHGAGLLLAVEAVLVLLLCIAVAYSLGALLNELFLPADYLLEVVTHKPDRSSSGAVLRSSSFSSDTAFGTEHESSSSSSSSHYTNHYDF